jgi:hypothetical protein
VELTKGQMRECIRARDEVKAAYRRIGPVIETAANMGEATEMDVLVRTEFKALIETLREYTAPIEDAIEASKRK